MTPADLQPEPPPRVSDELFQRHLAELDDGRMSMFQPDHRVIPELRLRLAEAEEYQQGMATDMKTLLDENAALLATIRGQREQLDQCRRVLKDVRHENFGKMQAEIEAQRLWIEEASRVLDEARTALDSDGKRPSREPALCSRIDHLLERENP